MKGNLKMEELVKVLSEIRDLLKLLVDTINEK